MRSDSRKVLAAILGLASAVAFGPFSQSIMDEAKKSGRVVLRMKKDWNRISAVEK
jgi:hypothetical protein